MHLLCVLLGERTFRVYGTLKEREIKEQFGTLVRMLHQMLHLHLYYSCNFLPHFHSYPLPSYSFGHLLSSASVLLLWTLAALVTLPLGLRVVLPPVCLDGRISLPIGK